MAEAIGGQINILVQRITRVIGETAWTSQRDAALEVINDLLKDVCTELEGPRDAEEIVRRLNVIADYLDGLDNNQKGKLQ
jgi:hypothetical protein